MKLAINLEAVKRGLLYAREAHQRIGHIFDDLEVAITSFEENESTSNLNELEAILAELKEEISLLDEEL